MVTKKTLELQKEFEPKMEKTYKILKGINNKSKNNANSKFRDLYSILSNPIIHIQALGNIRPNKGVGTPGIDKMTLQGMNMKLIEKIANEFKNKTYKFKPVRRVYIPKPGKTKKRPLGIPTLQDRIVQESIRLILESIYEPIFETLRNKNYGFRPDCSTHHAIKFLKDNGTACNIAIEGDIIGAYDNVNIDILINILNERIMDRNFLNLIRQGCHCGLMEFNEFHETISGVPQGGIASPILFNIYMHKFDQYINFRLNKILDKYNEINNRSNQKLHYRNNAYHNISTKLDYHRKMLKNIIKDNKYDDLDTHTQERVKQRQKNIKELLMKRTNTSAIEKSKRAIRIVYCRYADDWILLSNCKKEMALTINNHIKKWLIKELKLELSPEKTKITNLTIDNATFLGFALYTYDSSKLSKNQQGELIRTGGYNIKVGIDLDRIRQRFIAKGFCDKHFKPIGIRPYSVLSLDEIITKYNYIIQGMANYYIPAIDMTRHFSQIYYIISYSCYGTIATKRKTSIYKLLKNFGKPPVFKIEMKMNTKSKKITTDLKSEVHTKELYLVKYQTALEKAKKITYKINENLFEPMQRINWRTYKNLRGCCCICGCREDVEWHHVNSVRKGTVKGFAKVMSNLNRKQIPLCKLHHNEITQGRYNDIKVSELVEIEYWLS